MSPIIKNKGQEEALVIVGGRAERGIIVIGGKVTAIRGSKLSITKSFKIEGETSLKTGDVVNVKNGKIISSNAEDSALIVIGGRAERGIIVIGGKVAAIRGNKLSITKSFKIEGETSLKVGDVVDIKKGVLKKKA